MEATIVHPKAKYERLALMPPPALGYIHIAAAVDPPRQPGPPFVPRSERREALLETLKGYARQLEALDGVVKATVYRAVMVPPASVDEQSGIHPARYDVAMLIETSTPGVLDDARASEAYREAEQAVREAASDVHVMAAQCIRRIGDVDKTKPGIFLFNHFAADDAERSTQVWEHLAAWYVAKTRLDNSTLLAPLPNPDGSAGGDYVFVNHARWDGGIARFALRQFGSPSFWSYVVANLKANDITAMPVLYRLA